MAKKETTTPEENNTGAESKVKLKAKKTFSLNDYRKNIDIEEVNLNTLLTTTINNLRLLRSGLYLMLTLLRNSLMID
jgi:hypothetical protein